MKKSMWLLILVLALALVFAGCSSEPAAQTPAETPAEGEAAAPAENFDLVYGFLVSDQLHQYALPIGLSKGWFEEEGINIEKKEYTSAGVLTQAMTANDFDIGVVGVTGAMLAKAGGTDVVLVASNNHGGSALVVNPEINSFEDLAGKSVGHPGIGSNHATLLALLEQRYGVDVVEPTIKPTDMTIFAANGEVSGIICYEPHPSRVIRDAGFKMLLASNDILEDQQCCIILTSGKFIAEQPEVVQKVVKLNARATRYIIDNKDGALEIISAASGHDTELLSMAYDNMIYPWPAAINVETSAVLLQGLLDSEKIAKDVVGDDLEGWINAMYDKSFEQALIDDGYIADLEANGAE